MKGWGALWANPKPGVTLFQVFVIQIFLFQVQFTIVAKAFRATLDFINAHLQQRDQVASILYTVYF